MTLTQTLPETKTIDSADSIEKTEEKTDTAEAALPGPTTETPAAENQPVNTEDSEDEALKLDGLYNSASRLEVELEGVARRNMASLTPGQVGGFNAILKMARQLLPKSVALREDVDDVDSNTRPTDAHQALHVTIVPTLHNALPESLYEKHG